MGTPEEEYARQQSRISEDKRYDEDDLDAIRDLQIEVPRMPEVNPEIYRDVEPLLFRGFVYTPALVNGVSFVFKSLNQFEFEHLSFYDTDRTRAGSRRAFDMFLAYGVLAIDGTNVLPDREQYLPEIAEFFSKMDDSARRTTIRRLSEINRRASRAVILTEAYATEVQSRLKWAQIQTMDLMSPSVTGFAGTEKIGMNWGQLTWRAINHYEDVKDNSEREWENAKLVASAMAGKGMSKVYTQDKQRRKTEAEDRAARKDKVLRFALLAEPMDKSGNNAVITAARTVEELATQLTKDLKGEKDWHDTVVADAERRVQNQINQRKDQIQRFQDEALAKYGENHSLVGSVSMAGMTPEEVKSSIAKRRQLAAKRLAEQQEAFPELHDPKVNTFYEKWAQQADSSSQPSQLPGGKGLSFPVERPRKVEP